jgi:histidinol dehydrogenase
MSTMVRVRGEVAGLTAAERELLLQRWRGTDAEVEASVRRIIGDVRARGDVALRELALHFDAAAPDALEVPRGEWTRALTGLPADVRAALERAAANIAAFHRAQLPQDLEVETEPGVTVGRRADPLDRVGVYAPGGRAAYASSVLMGVVPAKVAGVREVIVCSPPDASGRPADAVLAACALAGADRVFAVGGAGAVAALAFGTETVPAVERITGPGNAYVTEAKRQVGGFVGTDSPAGPSEVLIIADASADPTLVAAELVAQAEHDPDAAVVLVATEATLVVRVETALATLLDGQPLADTVHAALTARGALLTATDLEEAAQFAVQYAPEHLLVLTREPRSLLPSLRCAGTIFLGAPSSVAFGDYITGANHVLPTAGLARSHSGLSTLDFVRWTTWQEVTPAAAARLAVPTARLAETEGLPGHAVAARLRAGDADTTDSTGMGDGSSARARARPGDRPQAAVATRAAYRDISPYDPGRTPCATDLSDNTSLFGPAPSVQPLLRALAASVITRYPPVYVPALKRVLADLVGVEPENITTGCGSDDVIDSAVRAFCEPAETVAYPVPTFGMLPVFARMNATRPVAVPLGADFTLDADALLATRARLTYICRPNNPTGTAFERTGVERVCTRAAGLVLIDEAYADFAGDDMAAFAAASDRTVVLRTLSKAFGLAGLRLGFAVGPAPLVAEIEKSRGPYKVSAVADAAARAVLSHDLGWVRDRVREVQQNRDRLAAELGGRSVRCWPSAANFVLAQVPGTAGDWNGRLRALGVAARPFAALPQAGECLRVSVGPWPMMARFLEAFDDVLNTMRL